MGSLPKTVLGNPHSNFWLYDRENGFDLTHPDAPDAPPVEPRIQMETTTTPITISPQKTAIVIIDMQNLFLSTALWGSEGSQGRKAEDALLSKAFPAARQAGIRVVHVTWGIADEELPTIPPVMFRIFGFHEIKDAEAGFNKERQSESGLGKEMGDVKLPDGSTAPAGRLLIRDQYNTALHEPLQKEYEASQDTPLPHARFHKNRLSGFWNSSLPVVHYLRSNNITTLLFGGVNTDQCVLASLEDANMMGFDTILLKDGCGTNSPDFAWKMVEFNCRKSWGFVSSCEALKTAVDKSSSMSSSL